MQGQKPNRHQATAQAARCVAGWSVAMMVQRTLRHVRLLGCCPRFIRIQILHLISISPSKQCLLARTVGDVCAVLATSSGVCGRVCCLVHGYTHAAQAFESHRSDCAVYRLPSSQATGYELHTAAQYRSVTTDLSEGGTHSPLQHGACVRVGCGGMQATHACVQAGCDGQLDQLAARSASNRSAGRNVQPAWPANQQSNAQNRRTSHAFGLDAQGG